MSGNEAVTTSYYPQQYHDPRPSYNSSSPRRGGVYNSQSVDLDYNSNERPPIMITGSCSQQQRLSKHTSIDEFSPRGQPSDPSRLTHGAYGYPSASYASTSQHNTDRLGHLLPDKRNCSVCTVTNERYALDASSSKDHDNEDDLLIHANNNSLCMCVFDGHDGPRAVQFVKRYMKVNIFDTKSWIKLSEVDIQDEMESALAEFIKVTDSDFFKSIKQFIDEKLYLQSQIPKVIG